MKDTGASARAASVKDAAAASEVVVLAVPWATAEDAVKVGDLSGKVLVDATNPLKPDLSELVLGHSASAARRSLSGRRAQQS